MKVSFQYGLAGFTGKAQNLVYYYDKVAGRVYSRRYAYPTLTQENERVGKTTSNIYALRPSEAYKEDLRVYALFYNSLRSTEKPLRSWVNAYMLLMYAMAKAIPAIDLKTLTREEIYAGDLPCISVKKAVLAGLIPAVQGWERLEGEM